MFGFFALHAQVRNQSIPYVARQRQRTIAAVLGTPDGQRPTSPVNFARAEISHFSKPQTEPEKQQQ
jgi:hypothetical protein